jgi:hypothetical protein
MAERRWLRFCVNVGIKVYGNEKRTRDRGAGPSAPWRATGRFSGNRQAAGRGDHQLYPAHKATQLRTLKWFLKQRAQESPLAEQHRTGGKIH